MGVSCLEDAERVGVACLEDVERVGCMRMQPAPVTVPCGFSPRATQSVKVSLVCCTGHVLPFADAGLALFVTR